MRSRCAYALRAAGIWEVRPASRVERIVSTYTGMMPGTPSPPSSVGVRARSVVLHSEPRALTPSECCTHRAARQRASMKTPQMGTPPWTGKTRRRHSVLPITSLSCEKDGESPAHVLFVERFYHTVQLGDLRGPSPVRASCWDPDLQKVVADNQRVPLVVERTLNERTRRKRLILNFRSNTLDYALDYVFRKGIRRKP